MRAPAIAAMVLALAACTKSNESSVPGTTATTSPVASAPVAAPDASAAPSTVSWSGRYVATPGPFTVPDGGEWAGVKFRGEDASVGLGDGTISVEVDPSGHAHGKLAVGC